MKHDPKRVSLNELELATLCKYRSLTIAIYYPLKCGSTNVHGLPSFSFFDDAEFLKSRGGCCCSTRNETMTGCKELFDSLLSYQVFCFGTEFFVQMLSIEVDSVWHALFGWLISQSSNQRHEK